MTTYNWQQPDWPNFQFDLSLAHPSLLSITEKTGYINGQITHLSNTQQLEAMINLMIEEAIKTSEIEGEYISRPDVRSSIINHLGLNQERSAIKDKRAPGVVELLFDLRNTFNESITEVQLFNWHLMLLSGTFNPNLKVGCWRTHEEPMQIVSGHHGKWKVHYEAPPSKRVPAEMKQFITWFNDTAPGGQREITSAPVRAAIAHLYFESIHPFEDGNGRIGRAIAEKALSQGCGYPVLFSLSQAIEADKKSYYAALNTASQSNEITNWINYFVQIILQAQIAASSQINFILQKSSFFDRFKQDLNERQLKVIHSIMKEGAQGYKGGMSAKKYMAITGTSKATATRDLQQLLIMKAVKQIGSGRSVRYELNFDSL